MTIIIRKNKLIFFFYFVASCIIIFCINYINGNDLAFPYSLSENYITLHIDNSVPQENNGFDFLKLRENITVIAETDDKSMIGLYDPTMNYYANSSKFINESLYRYFSPEDYSENCRVGIIIDSIDEIIRNGSGHVDIGKTKELYNVDIVNIFDYSSDIAANLESNPSIILNLFAINPLEIKTIYIDSTDIRELEEVKSEIEKYGYKEVNIKGNSSITSTICNSLLQGKNFVKFILYSFGIMYVLFMYVLFIYLSKYDKYVYINRLSGATFMSLLKTVFNRLFLVCMLVSFISSFGTIAYLEIINKNRLSLLSHLKIQVVLVSTFLIIFLVKNLSIFRKSNQVMR